jgi:hypothetical protein
MVVRVIFLLRNWEISDSNLGSDTDYPDCDTFVVFLSVSRGIWILPLIVSLQSRVVR